MKARNLSYMSVQLLLALAVVSIALLGFGSKNVQAECVPGNGVDKPAFFSEVAQQLRNPSVPDNELNFAVQAFLEWEPYENTRACWNPLATTWQFPEGDPCRGWAFNSHGVQNYPSRACGIRATANTINYTFNGTGQAYQAIRTMMAKQGFDEDALQQALHRWIGYTAYENAVLSAWRELYFNSNGGNDPGNCPDQYRAEYFENISLTGNPRFVRCEDWPINHEWGSGGPGNGVGNDNFSVRWTGSAHFDGGNYTFIARADDGIRVWLDDTLVIDAWRDQSPTEYRQTRSVSSGTHRIRVEFYEHGGGATAQFRWERASQDADCSADQYRAEYFENISLTGNPRFVRCEDWPINHEWGSGGPGNGVGNDNFSVRWTGSAHFDGGNYTFIARADDGIRVWLDDTLVIDAWRDQSPTVYRQTRSVSSGTHRIRVEFYEHGGGATAQFHWERSDSGGGGGGGSQGDRYEPDNSPAQAKAISTDGSAQTHDFHVAGDFDWLKFNATQGHRYTIETLNLGPNSDTYLYLYDTNGSSLLVEDDDGGSGYASRIVWTAPRNGAYFVKVRHYNRSASGSDTRYDIRIQDNGAGGGGSSNLVLGRSAYATSHESASRAPSKGNDGRRDTRWSSRISSSLEPQWWWVDLGSPQTFDRVVIRWEAAYAGRYFVGTSNDGQRFYGHWYTTNAPGSYRYDLGTRTARYIGVYMTERAPRMNNYSFWELEAYNTARRSSNQPQGMDAIEAISIGDSSAEIPAPAQLFQITTSAEQGKFKGKLKITKIELLPESGQPYLVLSLQGSGFTDMTKVAIWNEEGELSIDDVTLISNEELHVTLPPETKSGTYKVRVINSNGDMAAGTVTIPGPTDSHRIFLPMVVR